MPVIFAGRLKCALLLLLLIGGTVFSPHRLAHSQAQPVSSWLKPEPPVFNNITPLVPAQDLPVHRYNDCSPDNKFVTIPPNTQKLQSEVFFQACSTDTAYGQVGGNNIRLHNTGVAGPVKSAAGQTRLIEPIPNSNHILYVAAGSALYGAHRYIVKDFTNNIETVVQPNGSLYHRLKSGVIESEVKDIAGTSIPFSDTRFSANGKWMIGDSSNRAMIRLNIETGETLPFGPGYNYAAGIKPQYANAISGNGRYAIVAAYGYGLLRIYDLNTCVPTPDPVRAADCKYRDLLPAATSHFGSFKGIYHAQFSTEYSLRLYIYNQQGNVGYFTLTAAGEIESQVDYLAAGDSFASGEGAFNYKSGTDIRHPLNGCHLSLVSYPYLLAADAKVNSMQSVACSGARMRDIVSIHYPEELAQSKGKNDPLYDGPVSHDFLPGYRPQISFVESTKPARLTISIGGNDIGFSKILLACLAPGSCYANPQERLNLAHTIETQYQGLVGTFEKIKQSASTGAQIYALGYPFLADPAGNCALNVHLNSHEIEFSNQVVTSLNLMVKRAAEKAGVGYIDVSRAFMGFRLCEIESSGTAVHGLTAGDDKTFSLPLGTNYTIDGYFTGKESYHPNQLGHRLLSRAVAAVTNNFTDAPAQPLTALGPSAANGSLLEKASASTEALRTIVFEDSLAENILIRGQNHRLQTRGLQPVTTAELRIGYDNAPITTYTSTTSGQLSTTFNIPSGHLSGFQVLHLQAKNKAGEDVDIQKVVYIAQSVDNIDGDSIPNHQEKCLVVDPANIDFDEDGIDDACDGAIGIAPDIQPKSEITATVPRTDTVSTNANSTHLSHVTLQNAQSAKNLRLISAESLGVTTLNHNRKISLAGISTKQSSTHSAPTHRNSSSNHFLPLVLAITFVLSAILLFWNKWRKRA